MKILHKSFPLELKVEGDSRTIEGWASTFGNVDSDDDIVLPGAFSKSLSVMKPKMLWQHSTSQPIGVWDEAKETDRGLYVKGHILDTALGNDVYKLAKGGAIDSMSIGYAAKDYSIDRAKNIRSLKQVDLYEVSLVTFPANTQAIITRVKSDNNLMTEREFEEFLRDAGLSQKEAKTVVSHGYKALTRHRDDGADELTKVLSDSINILKGK
jgi:HK97 family phage prohead protease